MLLFLIFDFLLILLFFCKQMNNNYYSDYDAAGY